MGKKLKANESQTEIQKLLEKQREAFFSEVKERIGEKGNSDQNLLKKLNDHEKSYFLKMETAFKRLQEGKINICESCQGEIEFRRLKLRPISTLCIKCQTQKEENEKNFSPLDELNGEGFLSGSFLGRGCRS
ncbi:MAG TPA: TraR/DksA C4-type zinc finger protein [Nitrospiria bacterium]|jgi:DnaK suppressor protein